MDGKTIMFLHEKMKPNGTAAMKIITIEEIQTFQPNPLQEFRPVMKSGGIGHLAGINFAPWIVHVCKHHTLQPQRCNIGGNCARRFWEAPEQGADQVHPNVGVQPFSPPPFKKRWSMTIPVEKIGHTIFKRSVHLNLSDYSNDIKSFNILLALDGRRSVRTIAAQDAFDPDELCARIKVFYDQGLIIPVMLEGLSRGRAKKLLDAIIQKRSRGITAVAKSIKIKIALKGINPDSLTPDTPDDPKLLKKLLDLARSYGLQVKAKAALTKGKTKLILDSIITQRSGGDPAVAKMIRTKLILKGINPDIYSLDTLDDPNLVKRLMELASKLGVRIPSARSNTEFQIEQML